MGDLRDTRVNKKQTSDTALSFYLKQLRKTRVPTREEEVDLGREKSGGNEKARKKLIESNLRLAFKIAKDFRFGHELTEEEFEDIIQEANIGVIRGVEKYDYKKGFRFSTYGSWWIRQAIQRALREPGKIKDGVRVPHRWMELREKIPQYRRHFTETFRREPDREELIDYVSEMTGKKRDYVDTVINFPCEYAELKGNEDGDAFVFDMIENRESNRPESIIVRIEDYERLKLLEKYMQSLSPRDEDILRLRYGILSDRLRNEYNMSDKSIDNLRGKNQKVPLADVGFFIGVTPECVRQSEIRALKRLKSRIASEPLFGMFLFNLEKPLELEFSDNMRKLSSISLFREKKTRGRKPSLRLYEQVGKNHIKKCLPNLTEKQRKVIQLSYCINDEELRNEYGFSHYGRIPQGHIASALDMTPSNVSATKRIAENKIIHIKEHGGLRKRGRPKGSLEENRRKELGDMELAERVLPNVKDRLDREVLKLLYGLNKESLEEDYGVNDQNITYRMAGELLGLPVSNINYRRQRGMKQLKHYMDLVGNLDI